MTKTQTFGAAFGQSFTGEEIFLNVCREIVAGADFNTAVGRTAKLTGIAYGTVTRIFVDVEEGR